MYTQGSAWNVCNPDHPTSASVRNFGYPGPADLHFAAEEGNLDQVIALLAQKVDPNHGVAWSQPTALHLAAGKGHQKIVVALLEVGAYKEAPHADNLEHPIQGAKITPVVAAARNGHDEVVRVLLIDGAEMAAFGVDNLGETDTLGEKVCSMMGEYKVTPDALQAAATARAPAQKDEGCMIL